jgi:hypothetical protein
VIGSGRETMTGLAAGLSATEDRELLTQLNVDSTFGYTPSFEVTSEGSMKPSNNTAMLEALHNFEDLFGFDDALDPQEDGIDETYFSKDDPILVAVQEAGGTAWPTPWTEPNDWAISAEGGQVQGSSSLSGFEGGVFAEALQGLDVAPTIAGKNVRKDQLKAALVASFKPGTQYNRAVVKKLLDKSLKLASLAEKRALVTKKARDAFQSNLKQVLQYDREIAQLYPRVFNAGGKMQKTATDADLRRLLALRQKNVELGRATVRLQKLNLLSSAITHNTLTQLVTVQHLAQAVAAGAPEAVPALGLAFDKLGRENAKIRALRAKQRENWQTADRVKRARDSGGLEGFDELYGLDVVEAPFDQMENELAAFGSLWKKIKHSARSVGRTVSRVAKDVEKTSVGLVKSAVIAPAKGTIEAAKRISHGDVKGAFKSVGSSVVAQAKGLKDFAAHTVLKWGCDVANTRAFKAGVQAVGQAVGEVVGGIYAQPTVGGAVGNEAGGQVANLQRNTCGAMKMTGLTDGTFRPGRIDDAAKAFAKRAWKETFSPKAQFASLKRIAANAVGGQFSSAFKVGGVDVMSKVGLDANRIVSNNPAIQNLYRQGVQKLSSQAQKQFQHGAGGLLKKAGVPYSEQLVRLAQSGKMPDYASFARNVNIKNITEQGARLAQREASAIARRQVGKAVTRVAPGLNRSGSGLVRGNVTQADLVRIANQIAPADVESARGPLPMLSKYVSQPTADALPYVGSIGRDY